MERAQGALQRLSEVVARGPGVGSKQLRGSWGEGLVSPPSPPRWQGPPLGSGVPPLPRSSLRNRHLESGPRVEPPACRPPGAEWRARRGLPSAPRPRGLRLIFPAGKRRAADKGMPVVLRVPELGGILIPLSPFQVRKG